MFLTNPSSPLKICSVVNHSRTRGTPCRINTILIFILAPPLAFVTIQCWKFNHLSLFNLPQTSRVLELVFPFFSLFWLGIFPHSTKPAPPSLGLAGRTGPHCLSPALAGLSPHPLQNRVPRVQVLLPLPIHLSPGLAKTAWPGAFSCLCLVGHGLLNPALCCIRCCPPASVLNRFLPLFSPPAPKTHPVSPFLGFSGCV